MGGGAAFNPAEFNTGGSSTGGRLVAVTFTALVTPVPAAGLGARATCSGATTLGGVATVRTDISVDPRDESRAIPDSLTVL